MTRGADAYIGLDLGTSSLKGIALDGAGQAIATQQEAYETARPAAGRAEQDPSSWTEAARLVRAGRPPSAPPAAWRAIGLSGMIPTAVTVDDDGLSTGPAFTWEDCRAQAEAEGLRHRAGGRRS